LEFLKIEDIKINGLLEIEIEGNHFELLKNEEYLSSIKKILM